MNKLIYILFIGILALTACGSSSNDEEVSTDNVSTDKSLLPIIKFEEETFNFGTITQGEVVSHYFKFKNIGHSNLLITDVHGSCGCTIPKWSKKPIAPNASDVVEVTFDSDGKSGAQKKTVTLISNTIPNISKIYITANIVEKEKKDKNTETNNNNNNNN